MPATELLRGRYGRWLLEGGALFTILGGAYQVYVDSRADRSVYSEETCRRADAALTAGVMNRALTPEQAKAFVARKLKISETCDRKGER